MSSLDGTLLLDLDLNSPVHFLNLAVPKENGMYIVLKHGRHLLVL